MKLLTLGLLVVALLLAESVICFGQGPFQRLRQRRMERQHPQAQQSQQPAQSYQQPSLQNVSYAPEVQTKELVNLPTLNLSQSPVNYLPPAPASELGQTVAALYSTGVAYPGVQCCNGQHAAWLDALAQDGANRQASSNQCGHPNLQNHFNQATSQGLRYDEIACESFPLSFMNDRSLFGIARGMWDGWRQSAGHWRVASQPHRYWGAGMAAGSNGRWYATVCTAD